MTNDCVPCETAAPTIEGKRYALRDAHIGMYLSVRFIAVYFTLTMIATFVAETLLNTFRLNANLATQGAEWVQDSPLFGIFRKFYPDGTDPVTLISNDLVIVYLFAVAVYAIVRFTYHKAMRGEQADPYRGGWNWQNLKEGGQSRAIRLCWAFTPRRGVHKKVFILWLLYAFGLGLTTAFAGLVGVSIYISPELKFALYGCGAAFGLGLLEDLNVFKKIPPKEAIFGTLLAIVEGVKRGDASGTLKRISAIAKEANRSGLEDVEEVLKAAIAVLEEQRKRQENSSTS